MDSLIGKPIDRKDGPLKVTGTATYAAEWNIKNIAHGVTVQSTITKGTITNIDISAAQKLKGVLGILTYQNAMRLQKIDSNNPNNGKFAEKDLLPLQTPEIFYNGQHIAVVIAETFEIAEHAASLVKVSYNEDKPVLSLNDNNAAVIQTNQSGAETHRGDATGNFSSAQVKVEQTYSTPVYHHNAMEPHATTAIWEGDSLTVYDSTQSVYRNRSAISSILGIPNENVRVVSPFIGGGFGSKGFMWANSLLAPMAAKLVNRPVKIALKRTEQMFSCAGRRSLTIQKISIGADNSGKISSTNHTTTCETSFVDVFTERAGIATKILYDVPNMDIEQNIVKLNRGTPCPTRAPGEAPGTYAYEVAMDELADKLNIDPLQLRLINYAETNPDDNKEFSGKNLKECYEKGAQSIGWSNRNNNPGVNKEGDYLVGYGMATATYPANRSKASVKLRIYKEGNAVAVCCTQDIGTGTYTVMAQLMADALGLPIDKVEIKLGDSLYPQGPGSGGSQTMATTGPAVRAAALFAKSKTIKLAIADKKSPLYNQSEENIIAENGRLYVQNDTTKSETYSQILVRNKLQLMEAEATTDVNVKDGEKKPDDNKKEINPFAEKDEEMNKDKYSFHSFGAYFVKVKVDPLVGMVKVEKIAGAMDIGKILNEKTSKSQIMGGAIFGIGMALMEETIYDPKTGRIVTKDLADYLVPVHADMPEFEIMFTDEPDYNIGSVGARGAGEIGITGITAAINNAVYNATGKRIRDLPITPDKLI
ncbi:MAG TPA: xanthine dehydrogenase family protein molybdopterin-binding subunit [Parafilimonas sp.]|nr:xanthine dehydrogenase family protein molybdopterin-binding subunit [Parafilimonas sp.]